MKDIDLSRLRAELVVLTALLNDLPKDNVIDRACVETRLIAIRNEIEELCKAGKP